MDCIYEFDEADEDLTYLPMAARRALDTAGFKLSLQSWQSLASARRWDIARAGAAAAVDVERVKTLIADAVPAPAPLPAVADPDPNAPTPALVRALGPTRSLDAALWSTRSALDRYVLYKLFIRGREQKLARAYDEIFAFSHRNKEGEARMVGVHEKPVTYRRALASARICMSPSTLKRLLEGNVAKGDVLAMARVAGIQAAKRTAELIPLCHTLALTQVGVEFESNPEQGEVTVFASAEAMDRTGVEMEALVAASTAALTIYDMVKSVDRWMTIANLQLEEKSGGKSGSLRRGSE